MPQFSPMMWEAYVVMMGLFMFVWISVFFWVNVGMKGYVPGRISLICCWCW